MNYRQLSPHWDDRHHSKYLDIVRIALGVFLCIKGIEFARNFTLLNEVITHQVPLGSLLVLILRHYVIFAHIIAGFLLSLGLFTRFACLIQIPILIGAIMFVTNHFIELLICLIILWLLIYFMIKGSGTWSLDRAMVKAGKK